MNNLKYKGYEGSIEFSDEDNIFYGKILNTRDLVLYEGKTVEELEGDFHKAVDDYMNVLNKELINGKV